LIQGDTSNNNINICAYDLRLTNQNVFAAALRRRRGKKGDRETRRIIRIIEERGVIVVVPII
jgi:hypothetical protein